MENFHRMDACPVRDVLSRLGDKWTMLVLVTLKANGTMRFCDIQKTIGDISGKSMRKFLLVWSITLQKPDVA